MKNSLWMVHLAIWVILAQILPSVSLIDVSPTSECSTVILADQNDPFFSLAQDISESESAILVTSISQALSCDPTFLLWVASPDFITEAALIDLGLFQQEHSQEHSKVISTGIITGNTLDKARALWLRAPQTDGLRSYAVNAANPSAQIFSGRIRAYEDSHMIEELPLDKAHLVTALMNAEYLSFTGHGGSSYWVLENETRQELTQGNIPKLPNTAISSGSCQTLQPWRSRSIALRFVDQGAVVYAGFSYSPNEGYLIGEFEDLPFRYTWPEFPIGHVVQVQNRGTVQGFATFPFYHLLGDPRTALQSEAPYHLEEDHQVGDHRILSFSEAPAGLIPIHIPGGAAYSFVSVLESTAAGKYDPFYNSLIQMADIQGDKYILLVHSGGDFSLHLQIRPPWYWYFIDPLIDSLDHTLIYALQTGTGGDLTALAGGFISLIPVLLVLKRKTNTQYLIKPSILTGLAFATLHGFYYLARQGHVTITSKEFVLSHWAILATAILYACGAFLFWSTRSRIKKLLAMLIPTFPSWLMAGFGIVAITFTGEISRQNIGVPIWNYAIGEMPLLVFCLQLPLITAIFTFVENRSIRRLAPFNIRRR